MKPNKKIPPQIFPVDYLHWDNTCMVPHLHIDISENSINVNNQLRKFCGDLY